MFLGFALLIRKLFKARACSRALRMGIYKHISELWKRPHELGSLWRQRLIQWRKEPATLRIERPTRLDRARAVGYRAKQGIIVARQRVIAGGKMRPKPSGGRRPKTSRRRFVMGKNLQRVAEERANKAFPNCEVLNSYFVGADSKHYWYEVILVDRAHPAVLGDHRLKNVAKQRGRVFRGRTSAGRRSRGLRWKGKGAEKLR